MNSTLGRSALSAPVANARIRGTAWAYRIIAGSPEHLLQIVIRLAAFVRAASLYQLSIRRATLA